MSGILPFAVFITLFSTVLALSAYYVSGRFLTTRMHRLGVTALFMALQFGAPWIYRHQPQPNQGVTGILQWAAFLALGFFLPLLLVTLGSHGVSKVMKRWWPGRASEGRRQFLTVGLAATMTSVGLVQARMTPKIKPVDVPDSELPPGLDGLTIVQISDLHIGQTIRREFAERVVEAALSVQPDLIVLTGDFVDGTVDQLRDEVEPLFSLRAKYGVFYYRQSRILLGRRELDELLCGARIPGPAQRPPSRHAWGAKLVIAGVLDRGVGRMGKGISDPVKALEGAPLDSYRVMLAHQPGSVYEVQNTRAHLQLSGHTHSGQFFPWNLLVSLVHPYTKGLNRHKGKLWVYVNSGTGYWGPPNRFGIPSEITHLRLVRPTIG